ncbi:unnamed protein product [Linum trigynum]|uniref:Uncharacterized protein n=1 Tax=Linum trigynum TaxID=586398 RepID=A0AAV2GCX3_9ROSI
MTSSSPHNITWTTTTVAVLLLVIITGSSGFSTPPARYNNISGSSLAAAEEGRRVEDEVEMVVMDSETHRRMLVNSISYDGVKLPSKPATNCARNDYYCLDKIQKRKLYCDHHSREPACHA